MYQRKRTALARYQRRAPPTKRRRISARRGGLIPTYRGYQPRAFSRGEWKYLDITVNQDINTTATNTLLNGLVPGTGASQRVGMKTTIRSIEIRLKCTTTAATGVNQVCRWLILLDRQSNGAAPAAVTDFLLAQSTTAPRQLANRKRFKIIVDRAFAMGGVLNGAGTGSALPQDRMFKVYIKFRRPIVVEYNVGNAGTIADIASNGLFLVTFGTEVAGNTDCGCTGYIRTRYTDM